MSGTSAQCPGCTAVLAPGGQRCGRCGLLLTGPSAVELWQVDQALLDNDRRRRALLTRRDTLLALLRSQVDYPAPSAAGATSAPSAAGATSAPSAAGATSAPPLSRPPLGVRPETSQQSVQNLLLALGGLLLAVAAVVFTVVAWGSFGLGGRAAILLTFTTITLAAPVVLVRRKLSATAETIALIGLVLMALDGYAAYRAGGFGLDEIDGYGYCAAVLAVIAATAAGYARLVPLRLLVPVAIVIAQPTVPLVAAALESDVTSFALAVTIAAGLDVALIAAIRHRAALRPERGIAAVCAAAAESFAVPIALVLTFFAATPWRAAGVLALTGAVLIGAAVLSRPLQVRALLAGGGVLLTATAAVGAALPGLGRAGHVAPALAGLVVALGAIRAPRAWRIGGLGAAPVLLVAGGLVVIRPVTDAFLGPLAWLSDPWSGPSGARSPLYGFNYPRPFGPSGPAVLLTVVLIAASGAVVASAVRGKRGFATLAAAGTVVATAVAPAALDLSRPYSMITQGAIAAVLCLTAAMLARPMLSWGAGMTGMAVGVLALASCSADRTDTLVGLAVAVIVLAVCAAVARQAQVGAVAAGLFVLAVTGEGAAVVLAAGHDAAAATWAMLGVAAMAVTCVQLAGTRLPHHSRAGAVATAASCVVAALNAVAWVERPGLLLAAAGSLVVVAALRRPRRGEREAFLSLGALPLAGALLTVTRPLLEAYVAPYTWLGTGWGTAPRAARDAIGPELTWSGDALVPAVLAVIAVGGAAAATLWGRAVAMRVAVPAVALTGGVLPLAFDLSWPVALATLGGIALVLLAVAAVGRAHSPLPPAVSGPTAGTLAGTALVWSLAAAPATVLALTTTGAATLLAAVAGRTRPVVLVSATVSAAMAVLAAVAGAMAAGQPARLAAFAALGVAACLAALAAVLRTDRRAESLCCEGTAVAGAVLGLLLAAASPLTLSAALAVTGLTVGATALRQDRRPASYAGTGLMILGSWVRLADLGVTAPEAYTVPVGAVGLVIGWLRWRQRRTLSSWLVFGPGLASALLPSLAALVLAPANTSTASVARPFALGGAGLAIVLAGAWQRLQAPLVLGGGVLAAVTLHELAPWVGEVVAALPRWVPLATAGLLLLVLGATYEQRRRDLRRLRGALTRMS